MANKYVQAYIYIGSWCDALCQYHNFPGSSPGQEVVFFAHDHFTGSVSVYFSSIKVRVTLSLTFLRNKKQKSLL